MTKVTGLLVIGDSSDQLNAFKTGLALCGFEGSVYGVQSIAEAQAFFREGLSGSEPIAMVLFARRVSVSEMEEGLHFLKQVKQACLPCIVFTEAQETATIELCYADGCSCVQRPANAVALARTLEIIMRYWFSLALLPGRTAFTACTLSK